MSDDRVRFRFDRSFRAETDNKAAFACLSKHYEKRAAEDFIIDLVRLAMMPFQVQGANVEVEVTEALEKSVRSYHAFLMMALGDRPREDSADSTQLAIPHKEDPPLNEESDDLYELDEDSLLEEGDDE